MKNKLLFILFFILLLLLLFSLNISAFSFEYDGNTYDVTDELHSHDYLYVFGYLSHSSDEFYIYCSNEKPYAYLRNGAYEIAFNSGVTYLDCDYNLSEYCCSVSNIRTTSQIYRFIGVDNFIVRSGFSNFDLLSEEGEIIFEKNIGPGNDFTLELTVTPNDYTVNVPVVINSQYFSKENIMKYELDHSLDGKNWSSCDVMSLTIDSTGNTGYSFYYEAYTNGSVHFRFLNEETGEYIYQSVTINNIVTNQDNVNNYINGEFKPTPFLSIEYVTDTEIIISTQKFFIDELEKLECSYLKRGGGVDEEVEENWTKLNIRSFKDSLSGETMYQFYTSIYNNDGLGDGTYIFRFYNKETDRYTYATAEIIFQNIVDYNKDKTKVDETLDNLVNFFKERFGFLVYPFELIIDVLNKIRNIEFETPKFSVPDIYEPTTNEKLISAFEFNFNDLLVNDVLKTIHDIYLILIDAFIIFSLVNLTRKKIMGVLEK